MKLLAFLLLPTLLFGLASVAGPVSAAADIVANGGFEAGDFSGWSTTGVVGLASTWSQSGRYSAKLGDWHSLGVIRQTIKLPPDSVAEFSMWYVVFPGYFGTSMLNVSLGSVETGKIQSWAGVVDYYAYGREEWRQISLNLGNKYAGQSITISITGHGDVRYHVSNGGKGIGLFPRSSSHSSASILPIYHPFYGGDVVIHTYPYVDDIRLMVTKTSFRSSFSLAGLPSSASMNLYVDGKLNQTVKGSTALSLVFPINTTHTVSLEPTVAGDDSVRYICDPTSIRVSQDSEHQIRCKEQFLVKVDSPFGGVSGGGWYEKGSEARILVTPVTMLADGLLGSLGVKQVFQGWSGAAPRNPDFVILVDAPQRITASWSTDYSPLLLPAVITVFAAGLGFFAFKIKSRR